METSPVIVTGNATMHAALQRAALFAWSAAPILLIGETGVGKELFADYIHLQSPRSQSTCVKVGVPELPTELIESELFGYRKGAFTGAASDRVGLIEHASGGTLFLDDIDDASPSLQVKLLRALETNSIRPLGALQPIRVDVRLVAATKRDLWALVLESRFRSDLFFRISAWDAPRMLWKLAGWRNPPAERLTTLLSHATFCHCFATNEASC